MSYLTRTQVKRVVSSALRAVADLPQNIETTNFSSFNDFQKHLFLAALKSRLNAEPYHMNNGTSNHLAYYDVDLMPDSVDDWPIVGDCIDFVTENQKVIYAFN